MARLQFIFLESFAAGVFLLPILLVLNKLRFHNLRRCIFYFLVAVYFSAVWALTGLPSICNYSFHPNIQLIPFWGFFTDLKNSLLNILLFMPFGLLLPLLWQDYRSGKKLFFTVFSLSFAIEVLQIFTFRTTDINDIIANSLGGFLGWNLFSTSIRRLQIPIGQKNKQDLLILTACVIPVMLFAQPLLSGALWSRIR